MRRLRTAALALAASAVLAATFALTAAAAAPTALTGPVSAVGGTTATLTGTVNPGSVATDWWFEYGTSTSYGSKTATTAAGSGSANVPVNAPLTGLSPATTYHYRLVAKNASGTSNGADGVFTTASPPVVVTSAATGVGPTSATLGGTVNPNGQATTWFVEYGHLDLLRLEDRDRRTPARARPRRRSPSRVSGLTAGRTYHFRLVATSCGRDDARRGRHVRDRRAARGHDVGRELDRRRRAHGSTARVDPNGRSTTYFFEYGTTTSYGSKTSSSSAGSGTNGVAVSEDRQRAEGRRRRTTSASSRRATPAPCEAPTGPSRPLEPADRHDRRRRRDRPDLGARSRGSVNPNGRSTTWYFEYGTTTSYGSRTPSTSAGSGTSALGVFATLSNLSAGVTYHFRARRDELASARAAAPTRRSRPPGAPAVATGPVTFTSLSLTSARGERARSTRTGSRRRGGSSSAARRATASRTAELQAAAGSAECASRRCSGASHPGRPLALPPRRRAAPPARASGADASFATPPRPLDAVRPPRPLHDRRHPGRRRPPRHEPPRRHLRPRRQRHDPRPRRQRRRLRRPRCGRRSTAASAATRSAAAAATTRSRPATAAATSSRAAPATISRSTTSGSTASPRLSGAGPGSACAGRIPFPWDGSGGPCDYAVGR